eukprot:TRINITY_DN475_c0_g1_i3.p2 TRINITY_DN475_c0_g1~~TRINITY_DN475_c0_g1_i3.p2  ORF type:complete len:118 (+),score=10.30 TRINITY_DN475_c0_g1_i3:34-354(+)
MDALDSAHLFGTYVLESEIPDSLHIAVKLGIIIWFVNVGLRIAFLFVIHLPMNSRIWQLLAGVKARVLRHGGRKTQAEIPFGVHAWLQDFESLFNRSLFPVKSPLL